MQLILFKQLHCWFHEIHTYFCKQKVEIGNKFHNFLYLQNLENAGDLHLQKNVMIL